ncbi:DNA polymerase III subunit alpha [Sedimentisphaera salicampi]|uniref:DNA polymerase III subunit alpha n=1 Tax=Sedimentisphaera salicampi TaxID=1941349 RepID=UPI000B9ADD72|nr:DNA polymerase III subunit alpha [Sedimentisphaera salicampi]OXU15088.1 DNA polymerase III subunit alpha [Sedimentisphaera salicampi]
MSNQGFAHLHLHTEYSLLDGAVKIPELLDKCNEYGMSSAAMTDHGNLYGAIDFYKTFAGSGVKPIIGLEAYYTPGKRQERTGTQRDSNFHLLLLAENNTGYQNLIKLTSLSYTEGLYYKPRVDDELLSRYSEGIIACSACLGGIIPQYIIRSRHEDAVKAAENYARIFGENNFFIELQRHSWVDEEPVDPNPEMIEMANKLGLGLVATNDVHFLNKNDYEAHDILTCISTGKIVSDENRMHYPTSVYLKSPEEMRELFSDIPEACDNTLKIAERCNVEIDLETQHAPKFSPPDKKTPGEYLRELVYKGAEERYSEITEDIKNRIEREIGVIDGKGFSSYFLIVWEFCNWAAKNGIPTGARGSGVGTIVGYCLGLCNVDPIKYGLLFERFMDPERNEMPDIDIDICQDGRPALLNYVREKYGEIAQITTFGTMGAKCVIRDVGRALDVPLPDVNRVAKMIPEGPKVTLEGALEDDQDLKKEYENSPQTKKLIDTGRKLEGLSRHAGVHACAVVIADEPLDTMLPLYRQSGSEDLITQFEGSHVEDVGLLKMDFLGLRTLSIIESTKRKVKRIHGVDIDIEAVDTKDQEVLGGIFGAGKTKGVFQFESAGMVRLLKDLKPDRLEDLIAANALYRPGPMDLIDDFIARKHGAKWEVPHPVMKEVLEETFGIMVYQEQVMQICHRLGGIKLREAYKLIKAISKKKEEVIADKKQHFIDGCVDNGLEKQQAEDIFSLINKFAGYGFNKSHSSRYAFVAFQTAYLKQYWPVEFMASLLTYEKGDQTKAKEYFKECKAMGIDILPPDINESFVDFKAAYDSEEDRKNKHGKIRFGLGAIKGLGEKAIEKIIQAREECGGFTGLYHFCENVDLRAVTKQSIEALVKAGAFDRLGASRAQFYEAVEPAVRAGQTAQADKLSGQGNLFAAFGEEQSGQEAQANSLPDVPAWPPALMLSYEKDLLGIFVTSNPLSRQGDTITAYSTAHSDEIPKMADGADIVIGGMITDTKVFTTKSGKNAGRKMCIVSFEDLNGECEIVLFPDQFAEFSHLIEQDKIIFVQGKVDKSRDNPQIIAKRIILPELVMNQFSTNVFIKWESSYEEAKVEKLKRVITEYSGKSPVFLEIKTEDGSIVTVQFDGKFSVTPDQNFRGQVRSIAGDSALELRRSR